MRRKHQEHGECSPSAGGDVPKRLHRRRWWRWVLVLLLMLFLLDEAFTFIRFEPPYCGHAYYETVDGNAREAYRAYLKRKMDSWGEYYWEFEDGTLLRYDPLLFSSFGIAYDQLTRRTADRISEDTTIDGVVYPAPPYLEEVRRELAEKHGPDRDFLQGKFVASNCDMMAAVVLTPESYARYRAARGLPPLPGLPPVPQPTLE